MAVLVVLAQRALGMTQSRFGELLGLSRATIGRWAGRGFTGLIPSQVETLVRALYPVDAELAIEVAAADHQTLESLGVVVPLPPPAVQAPVVHAAHLIDSVVCAAADAVGQLPSTLRPSLLAAFERASAVGLSMDDVVKGLRGST